MKDSFEEKQIKIFRRLSAEKKIRLVSDYFQFARRLAKKKNPKVIIALDDEHYEKTQ